MGDENEEVAGAVVPSARLREETGKKRQALARVGELEAQVGELEKRAATSDTLAAQLEALKTANAAQQEEWKTERAVWQAGITDPEAIGVAKHLWSQTPEQGRKPFAEVVATWKAEPDKAPKAMQGYLPKPDTTTEAPATKSAPPRAGGASPGSGPPAAGGQWTEEQIRTLRQEAERTGDWSKYKEARPGILASIAARRR